MTKQEREGACAYLAKLIGRRMDLADKGDITGFDECRARIIAAQDLLASMGLDPAQITTEAHGRVYGRILTSA